MWTWRLDLEFESWIARIGTFAIFVATIKALQTATPGDVRHYFSVRKAAPSPSTPW